MRILFVTWDGPQVSYVESLFLPIFAGLKAHGIHVDILQFRWGSKAQAEAVRAACRAHGCGYAAVAIHRRLGGIGPLFSAVTGARAVKSALRRFGSDIIMPRSLMPALAVLRAGGARLRPLIFDADGLAVDERVEFAGLDPAGATYRLLRDVEAQAVRQAEAVITRSSRAADILIHRAGPPADRGKFHVVANGRDAALFHPQDQDARLRIRAELGIDPSAPLLVYAGSVGPQYRFDLVASLTRAMERLDQRTRLLVLSGSPERAVAELHGLGNDLIVMRAAPGDVPFYLAAADIGLAYRAASFSMQGVAPVKLAEYLLCGLAVAGTAAVGDTGAAVEAGLLKDEAAGPEATARWIVGEVLPNREAYREAARLAGTAQFSLERSVADYRAALERFLPGHVASAAPAA